MKLLKTLALLIGMTWMLQATPLMATPIMNPDAIPLSPADPGIGRAIMATPGTAWDVWGNDNWANTAPGVHGDFDFNDGHGWIEFLTTGQAQWLGANAGDTNEWVIGGVHIGAGNPGPFVFTYTPNTELVIQFVDTTTGNTYLSGPGARNPDGAPHVWTEQMERVTETPEPATWGLAAIGVGFLVVARKLRRKE
jgi:hypothetical protein